MRRGTVLKVGNQVSGSGCKGGSWYKATPFGYVCTALGFHVSDTPSTNRYGVPPAKVSNHLPYQYSRVITKRAPRYYRIPTVQEEKQARRAMEKKGATPEAVSSLMEGDYFLALAEKETRKADGAVFYRTIRGRFVRENDVELRNPEVVRGEELGRDGWRLPLAIVYGEDRELLNVKGSKLRVTGTAKKHARFVIEEELTKGDVAYVSGTPGAVRRDEVRVVRQTKRPSSVPASGKWIHVDLSEQTLVAYEGDKPVYATLISSGKEGYEPPTGLFEVQQKYISTTMNATDPIDGFYEVEEVPWTLYYHGGFALHGAYWHTDFGKVRSHGCTNIAPVDARLALLLERTRGPSCLARRALPAGNDLGSLHQLSAPPRRTAISAAAPATDDDDVAKSRTVHARNQADGSRVDRAIPPAIGQPRWRPHPS